MFAHVRTMFEAVQVRLFVCSVAYSAVYILLRYVIESNRCPIALFGVDLDWIPWGRRTTTISHNGFIVNGLQGPCGIRKICTEVRSCIEVNKARWVHTQGNPAPLYKLNRYLEESLARPEQSPRPALCGAHS